MSDQSCELGGVYDRLEVLKVSIFAAREIALANGWGAVLCDVQRELREVCMTLGYGDPEAKFCGHMAKGEGV